MTSIACDPKNYAEKYLSQIAYRKKYINGYFSYVIFCDIVISRYYVFAMLLIAICESCDLRYCNDTKVAICNDFDLRKLRFAILRFCDIAKKIADRTIADS